VGINFLTLMLYAALAGLLVLVPYVLIQEAGYSGLAAGAALLPFPLVIATTSPMVGALAGTIGARIPLTAGPLLVAAGFVLATRIGSGSSYWTAFLPAILIISFGMACAVAPLTTAVLNSVDAQHTGLASGFNSAVARMGGLVATALLGSVLAASGPELIANFRVAVGACAIASLAAAISAYVLIAN
jgi:predicted MFS family arabinose efflux permease